MGKSMSTPAKLTTALAAGLLMFGAAACSSSDDSATPTTTAAVDTETPSPDTEASGTSTPLPPGAAAGAAPTVQLDDRPIDASFEPARCEWGTDDGRPQLEFRAGSDATGGDLDVELVTTDPPILDDFTLEADGTEWEATSENRRDAQITVDGDNYRIISQVTEDDGTRTAKLEAHFTCAGR
ncbi:MAG: hypothetical protein GX610_04850 [Rhodococcus sp.]|nr:hypothetical protein [Rhodococcus sp. (in: high G+C Gram-positive bacteria)]